MFVSPRVLPDFLFPLPIPLYLFLALALADINSDIINAHNSARSQVKLGNLHWNDTAAAVALKWANVGFCVLAVPELLCVFILFLCVFVLAQCFVRSKLYEHHFL